MRGNLKAPRTMAFWFVAIMIICAAFFVLRNMQRTLARFEIEVESMLAVDQYANGGSYPSNTETQPSPDSSFREDEDPNAYRRAETLDICSMERQAPNRPGRVLIELIEKLPTEEL